METPSVEIGVGGLSAPDVVAVARQGAAVSLSRAALEALDKGAAAVRELVGRPDPVYGVTTGFGALAGTVIPSDRSAELQLALVRSHAAGMGPELEREVIRAMMVLRARSLAMGYSGARREVAQLICDMLNHDLTPVVREHGSVGASGDLAPLAAVAVTLIGEGEVDTETGRRPSAEALAAAGLSPVALTAKEGLALINGTDGMLGMLVMALADLDMLYRSADIIAAMTIEALLGTDRAFDADLVAMRPQPGQQRSAANLRGALAGSQIVASHRDTRRSHYRTTADGTAALVDSPPGGSGVRVQDAYSLRCTPQVHGAGRDVIAFCAQTAEHELASFIDNPVVLPDGRVASCGNFHGAPVAYAADLLRIPIADLSALSERRTDRLLDHTRSAGLPPFLTEDAGVNSGLMIAQYTQAAMVAANRRLAAPASVDTISTSAGQEDHVSMGWGACRALRQTVDNLRRILTVELLAASHGQVFRRPLAPSPVTGALADVVLGVTGGPGPDRHLDPRLAALDDLLADGVVVATAADHMELA